MSGMLGHGGVGMRDSVGDSVQLNTENFSDKRLKSLFLTTTT